MLAYELISNIQYLKRISSCVLASVYIYLHALIHMCMFECTHIHNLNSYNVQVIYT